MTENPNTTKRHGEAIETVDVLLRRREVIDCLAAEPKDKRGLVAAVDVSRSTVDRATRELETAGLIEHAEGRFVLTPLGELVHDELSTLVETIQLRRQLDPLLQWIPSETLDLDLAAFADADLVVPEPGNPYHMVNRHVQGLERADSVRALLPLTGLHAFEAAHTTIVDRGADYEFVVVPDVAETYDADPDYAPLCAEMVDTGRFEYHVHDGDVPYYLGLLDDTVQIGVDEAGEPRALLESDTADVRDWAENTYREYRERAEPAVP